MIRSNLVIRGKRCLEENVDSLNSDTYKFISEALRTLEQEPKDAVSRDAIRLKIADMPKYHNGTKIQSTRQLKEFLEKAYEETIDVTPDICLGFTLALDYIREYIEDLPPVTPTWRWIPVSKRPPEEGKSVLVCYKTQGGMAQAVSERFDRDRWSALCGMKPIAWSSLPEPYHTESEVK